MELEVAAGPPEAVAADVLAVPVLEPARLLAAATALDAALGGRLTHLAADRELRGAAGHLCLVHTLGELGAHRVAAAGVGAEDRLDADALRTAASRVAAQAGALGGGTIAWALEDGLGLPAREQARAIVEGTALGDYEAGRWKTGERERAPVTKLVLVAGTDVESAARAALVAARWTNRARDLVNAPANELTPERLAAEAEAIAAGLPHTSFEALDRAAIEAAGMGAFAAVARGSAAEPRLIVLDHAPPGAPEAPRVALVGKAVTFDTGGISLKPSARMEAMKGDMAGGAAALCGLAAVAELGLPLRVCAVVAACENMPGGRSFRPGDILTAANGKTIEVTNTDAEGRLVLADALVEARRRGATHVLDLATLTGGITVTFGDFYAGLLGNDETWVGEVRAAAEASGDRAWPLPLHDTYKRLFRSTFADMKNSSDHRQAVSIYAALFLREFAGDGPWAHLDIAGTAYLDRSRGDYYTKQGATGFGVRLIAELGRRLCGER
jgi:leucyl aminopeptidase